MSKMFYFTQCPKRQRGVNNFRVTLVLSELRYTIELIIQGLILIMARVDQTSLINEATNLIILHFISRWC